MHADYKNTEICEAGVTAGSGCVCREILGKPLLNVQSSALTLNNDWQKMKTLHFFVVSAPAVLHKLIPLTTSGRSIRLYTCWSD